MYGGVNIGKYQWYSSEKVGGKGLKKICIIGCFADGLELLNGQTIKTKIVYQELERVFGADEIIKIDTYGGIKTLLKTPAYVLKALFNSKKIIILPAQNGLRVIVPILVLLNLFFRREIYYDVIGGWLPSFLKERVWLNFFLKKINAIFVETNSMKRQLVIQGYKNVEVLPNCKKLRILNLYNVKNVNRKPYKLCTFSRVMREKGVEEAVRAVQELNEQLQEEFCVLDIYGQVDLNQKKWFNQLKSNFPNYIKYKGVVPFSQSIDVLKNYDALLFPTYYEGEGFAGTIIDAYAAGLPVIASDWKYNSEIIKNDVTGKIVPVHDIQQLKQAIKSIDSNNEKWNMMRKKCVQEAKKYLPENAMKIFIEKLY